MITEIKITGFDLFAKSELKQPSKAVLEVIKVIPGIQLEGAGYGFIPSLGLDTITFTVKERPSD